MYTYEGCKCNIGAQFEKQREEEKVHQFLMGLDDMLYETVRSNLLGADPLHTLNRVYSILIEQERVNTISPAKEEQGEFFGLCAMQDRTSRMPIGSGERRDGLYYFRAVPQTMALKTNEAYSLDLLYKRLGHPSLKVTKLV